MVLQLYPKVAVLLGQTRYLVFVGVPAMLRGYRLLREPAYLLSLVANCTVKFRNTCRILLFDIKVLFERFLLVVNLHVQTLDLGLVGIVLGMFGLSLALGHSCLDAERAAASDNDASKHL